MQSSFFCVQSQWQRLVRRMTRFFTTVNADVSLSALKDTCEGLSLCFKLTCTKQVQIRAALQLKTLMGRDKTTCTTQPTHTIMQSNGPPFCPLGDGEHS